VRKRKECVGYFLSIKLKRISARSALKPKSFKVDEAQQGYRYSILKRNNSYCLEDEWMIFIYREP
jgi:hypothetical protein